jgi:predicted nucleotidyltransferase
MQSKSKRLDEDDPAEGATVSLRVPAEDAGLYRYGATDPVLRILVDAPGDAYGIRELARATGYSPRSVSNAVDALEANGVVRAERGGNRTAVALDPDRVSVPDDPVLRVPQPSFHAPVRAALERLREELTAVAGVVLFGSVARGEADRRSDIDLWILVEERRGTNQRRAAGVADDLEGRRFDGDRYAFEVLVESTDSAVAYADRLEAVLGEGITLYGTETLRAFEREVLADG